MSKLVITVMNGIGGLKGPRRRKTQEVEYLSHVVNEMLPVQNRDGTITRPKNCPITVPHIAVEGKGGISEVPERKIYDLVRSNLVQGDVWVAFGYSYGVWDTARRLIDRFWKDRPTPDVFLAFGSFDGDYMGRFLQSLIPGGRRLRARPEAGPKVHYHLNRFQTRNVPGGMRFNPCLAKAPKGVSAGSNMFDQVELDQGPPIRSSDGSVVGHRPINHHEFDTLPAVGDAVRHLLTVANAEAVRRNKAAK